MATNFYTKPGLNQGPVIASRNIHFSVNPGVTTYDPAMLSNVIDGALSRDVGSSPTSLLRCGLLMGKITTGGKYRPSIIGVTTAAAASNATSITVPAAVATEVARLITAAGAAVALKVIGPPTAAGTVAVIDVSISAASGTSLTIASSGTIGTAAAAGSIVCPGDGAHLPVTILDYPVYGLDVVDMAGSNIDQLMPRFLRSASLITANIINMTTDGTNAVDTSVTAWIKTQLGARYTWNDSY